MFRSKATYEAYLKSLEDEQAAPNDQHHGLDVDIDIDDEQIALENGAEDSSIGTYIDPSLLSLPKDFNDNEEVLIIDGAGNITKLGGRVTVKDVHGLNNGKRIIVPLNKLYQPVKKAGSLFNRFLANMSRRAEFCPLNYKDWRLVPKVYKNRLFKHIQQKFMLPPNNAHVEKVVLGSMGDKLRSYRKALRSMYKIKNDGTNKEELQNLPGAETGNGDQLTRPKGVSQQMWIEFVEFYFSDKFEQYSKVGTTARDKLAHTHTTGSQSFVVARDKFEQEHGRDPGGIEWFVKTHETKEKTFHQDVTQVFVDKALGIIKQKTGVDEVDFSYPNVVDVEKRVYEKLMGKNVNGRVVGYGPRVYAKDFDDMSAHTQSQLLRKLMNQMFSMQKEIDDLKAKLAAKEL